MGFCRDCGVWYWFVVFLTKGTYSYVWYYFCCGARKSLKLANSSYHILCSCSLLRCWGLGHELPLTKEPLGTVCTIQATWSCYSQAVKALFCFLFAEYWFQNQPDFRSPNDGWSQERKISGWGPTESPSYILRHRSDILYAGCGHGYMRTTFWCVQVRKLALGINSNLLFQVGFYSWILDRMCWYKEHFYSGYILLSLC